MPSKRSSKEIISENQKTWDKVADQFVNASSLPDWGPFGVGSDLNLFPQIKGKTFLEIGCGSGRSIKYLTKKGAKKVYGLDISSEQIKEATKHNKKEIELGEVELIQGSMEKKLKIEPVDYVYSVYAIGWTPEPEKTLKNIYSYLKPGGLFIWSWDHTIFSDVSYEDGKFVVIYSYHDENLLAIKDWKAKGSTANITYRKTSTWFQLLRKAGFEIDAYYEPEPRNLNRGHEDPKKYYSIQKAKLVPSSFVFVCRKGK
ncbi:class I SAM-dependent methyltransferase [Candidatus Dojkabacteria bacterium]|uniref:Class I SAM-dependent methyltransferase n=1 Tax=Candidatus Dojkabacteria bacterium TaxID=2099670 RepID=A0A955RI16_9BACT|nr:class I SAM-dependent methyltransferase [Candidatus Dojkabacteria bacterium]